jgi:predicted 3-demethylubiquinone-9 3-methyltransferase (glyoxalase superfamily)
MRSASSRFRERAMQLVRPFLWYDDRAVEAARFYTSIFKNSKILAESESMATFEIDGQEIIAFNGGPHFTFTEAISLFVNCETQDEIDEYWAKLCDGGKPGRCGWLTDKFGLSWQIVPLILGDLLGGDDEEKSARAMQAMLQMSKLDIARLK